MNSIDIFLFIPLAYAAYKGFTNGFIVEICTLLALFVGLYAGIHLSDGTASFIANRWEVDSQKLTAIAFTVTFLAVGAGVFFGGKALEKLLDIANLTLFNKIAGVVFSVLKFAYALSIIIVLIESYDKNSLLITPETKESSLFYTPVKKLSLLTIPYIGESQLFSSSEDSLQIKEPLVE